MGTNGGCRCHRNKPDLFKRYMLRKQLILQQKLDAAMELLSETDCGKSYCDGKYESRDVDGVGHDEDLCDWHFRYEELLTAP